jgi:hypothetical protein
MQGSQQVVTPVKTGVQPFRNSLKTLDSGLRRNDRVPRFLAFYEDIVHKVCPAEFFTQTQHNIAPVVKCARRMIIIAAEAAPTTTVHSDR